MSLFFSIVLFVSSSADAGSAWNATNSPANMNSNYNYTFDQLPEQGSVDAKHTPWSDNYWESDWGGISLRWKTLTVEQRDPDLFEYQTVNRYALFTYTPPTLAQLKTMTSEQIAGLSPAEKYDIMMRRYDYPTVQNERELTGPGMSDWQGLCHGWVAAAANEAEPLPTVEVNADDIKVPFGSSDIKGLLTYYYGVSAYDYARGSRQVVCRGGIFQFLDRVDSTDPISWLGLAADAVVFAGGSQVFPNDVNDSATCVNPDVYAQYGSLEKCVQAFTFAADVDSLNGVGQVGARDYKSDPNAGAFFVVMTNQLGLMHQSFLGNLNRFGHNQIWNQPISGFSNHIDYDHRGSRGGDVGITTTLNYVSEIPQNDQPVIGTPAQRFADMTFSYKVNVDRYGQVTGGDWQRGTHPGFIWKHNKTAIKGYFTKLNQIFKPRAL